MAPPLGPYDLLARVLATPADELPAMLDALEASLTSPYPAAAEAVRAFRTHAPTADGTQIAELYVRTFEVQAITTLDIGYTLFGEDYKRGALLANLSHEHQAAGNDCGLELADHLTNVLRLLTRMADAALRAELVSVLLAPALRRMIAEFEPARIAKKEEIYKKHHKTILEHAANVETRTAYRHLLAAVLETLRVDFQLVEGAPVDAPDTFEQSIGTEMTVEARGACAPGA